MSDVITTEQENRFLHEMVERLRPLALDLVDRVERYEGIASLNGPSHVTATYALHRMKRSREKLAAVLEELGE